MYKIKIFFWLLGMGTFSRSSHPDNQGLAVIYLVHELSQRQSIRSLPDDSMLSPPMSQRTKKRKCNTEEEPLERTSNSSNTSNFIPNSQECVDISSNNVITGPRQRKKRF